MKKILRNLILYGSAAGLLVSFFVQMKNQVIKYMHEETTISVHPYPRDKLIFPAVSLCPGFRSHLAHQTKWFMTQWNKFNLTEEEEGSYPENLQAAERFWQEVTVDAEEITQSVKVIDYVTDEDTYGQGNLTEQLQQGSSRFLLETLHTTSGRCYSVQFLKPSESWTYFKMTLSLPKTNLTEVQLLFHNPKDDIGLNSNNWLVVPASMIVTTNTEETMVRLSKRVLVHSHLDDSVREDAFLDCHRRHALLRLFDQAAVAEIRVRHPELCARFTQPCFFPSFWTLLGHSDAGLAHCADYASWRCMSLHAESVLDHLTVGTRGECPKRDKISRYVTEDITIDAARITYEKTTTIKIRFATLDELEERQYPLMDLSTMVGALGGSLGMLLGFSCLDAVRSCLNAWEKLVYTDSLN